MIKEAYPRDEAINYNLGDFRGMWSLEFSGDEFERDKLFFEKNFLLYVIMLFFERKI